MAWHVNVRDLLQDFLLTSLHPVEYGFILRRSFEGVKSEVDKVAVMQLDRTSNKGDIDEAQLLAFRSTEHARDKMLRKDH
jgi:hypothetical protein